jgi:hypothetical protein
METIGRRDLLQCAAAYKRVHGVKNSTLSLRAHGDPPFFDKLQAKEGDFTFRKYDEVMQWFSTNWPEGAKWPGGVIRPKPGKS